MEKQTQKYSFAKCGIVLARIASLIVAGGLAYNAKEGWGWFLFVGFVLLYEAL